MRKKFAIILLLCLTFKVNAGCLESGSLSTLSVIADQWLNSNCYSPIWCYGADFDLNNRVDLIDFSGYFGGNPIVLVSNGQSNVSIHNIVSGTSSVESYAAQQLQAAFTLATGAAPAINPSAAASVRINLGVANRFTVGINDSSSQAYTVRTTFDGNIELVGNSANAVLWAVDDFCEHVLGVTWPAANGTAMLKCGVQLNLTIEPICTEQAPDFERRGWLIGSNTNGPAYDINIVDWMARNRQSIKGQQVQQLAPTSFYDAIVAHGLEPDTGLGHSFFWLVEPSIYWDNPASSNYHPEYFPLINGVRVRGSDTGIGNQLCVSNSGVYNRIISKVVNTINTYPKLRVFGIVPNDGRDGWCQCANCVAWDGDMAGTPDGYSNRLIKLCNKVADYLHVFYPDVKIGTLAYSEFVNPPTIKVSDNVIVYYCTGGRNYMKKLTDPSDVSNAEVMTRINGWLAKSSNVGLYEYYYTTGLKSTWLPISRTLVQEYPELKALGIKGISVETTSDRWPNYIANVAYTFARATWDTSLSYDQILTDYCDSRYGGASADMKSFYRLYEDTIYNDVSVLKMFGPAEQLYSHCFTGPKIALLEGYITSAETIASGSGNAQNISAIAQDRSRFELFKRLVQDPQTTIPGIGPNLVVNPGAESGATGWITNVQSGSYSFSVSNADPHTGSSSLKIECTGASGWARWVQAANSPVIAGHKYTGRFWIKATGTGSWGEIWFYQGGAFLERLAFEDTGGQWRMIVAPEVVASGDNSIKIYVNTFGPGTVQIDDCFFAELPAGY